MAFPWSLKPWASRERESEKNLQKREEVNPKKNIYGIEGGKGVRESIQGDRRK